MLLIMSRANLASLFLVVAEILQLHLGQLAVLIGLDLVGLKLQRGLLILLLI